MKEAIRMITAFRFLFRKSNLTSQS